MFALQSSEEMHLGRWAGSYCISSSFRWQSGVKMECVLIGSELCFGKLVWEQHVELTVRCT